MSQISACSVQMCVSCSAVFVTCSCVCVRCSGDGIIYTCASFRIISIFPESVIGALELPNSPRFLSVVVFSLDAVDGV